MSTPTAMWRSVLAMLFAAACSLLASCGGAFSDCPSCAINDQIFYQRSDVRVNPGSVEITPGETATAQVTVSYADPFESTFTSYHFAGLTVVGAPPGMQVELIPVPGLDENRLQGPVGTPACTTAELSATAAEVDGLLCAHYTVRVTTSAQAEETTIQLSAQWQTTQGTVIERLGAIRVAFPRAPPPPPGPDFQVAVGGPAAGSVYGTRANLPVSITRTGGFTEEVTLEFSGLTSGVVGSFAVEPVPSDRRSLELQIPARYAEGGRVDLQVMARSASGQTKIVAFSKYIEPLFKLILQPGSATLTTAAPLRVDVGLKAGDLFRSPSIGVVELSISPSTPLPDGVTGRFVDDATPTVPVLPVQTVSRVLELVTDGRPPGVSGPLQIRGTARGVPPDPDGVFPFIEITLNLNVEAGQSWQFVGNNLTYGTRESNVIGLALQSDNRPVLAWLEGTSGRVLMRRFDGTTFAPSPPLVDLGFGLTPPALSVSSGIAEASFALTPTDAGQVAFMYDSGTRLALGRADRGSVAWSISPPWIVGDPADAASPRARSPRVATGPFADAVVVSYIQEANAATTTGGVLHVLRTFGNGVLAELPTSLPGGALNASPTGSVVRHATALALRADGNPWVAWIENATNPAIADKLWLRAYDGNDWGPAIGVPTPRTPVGATVQLLVEPSGLVVVAWLEGSPAQLMVSRYDPSTQSWTPLDFSSNLAAGSLNVSPLSPALDVHLAREPGAQGRLLVTWTEGGADPRVWIRRRDANGDWRLVGTTVSQVDRWAKTPRIVSDSNNRLYVAWATYAAGQNPGTFLPYADIDVAQWIFP